MIIRDKYGDVKCYQEKRFFMAFMLMCYVGMKDKKGKEDKGNGQN